MIMDEISGHDVHIILNIKEGRGFGALRGAPSDKMFIEATLNGSVLDTDILSVTEEPLFDSELMWESNKKSLRRLRSGGITIKVQCFLVNGSLMKRERIGHFTISLREAHVVPTGKSFEEIGESWWHWQKLNGTKPPYPEILYSLRLEGRPAMPDKPNLHEVKGTRRKSSPQKQARKDKPVNPNLITRLHSDKGVIQIGSDETSVDYFTLTIYVGQAVNLDLLLPGNYNPVDPSENEQLCFHYNIMDFAINTANMSMEDIHKPVSLNEKMVISLCSSLENLEQYFSASSKLLIRLMSGHNEIGFAEMPLKNLVPTTKKEAFCDLGEDNAVTIENPCFLQGFITKKVPISPSGLQPYIHLRIKLKYEEPELIDIGQGEGQTKVTEIGHPHLTRSSSYTILDAPVASEYNIPTVETEGEDDFYDNQRTEKIEKSDLNMTAVKQNKHHIANRDLLSRGYWQASGDIDEEMNTTNLLKEIKAPTGQSQLMSVSAIQFRTPSTFVEKECQSEQMLHDNSTQAPEGTDQSFHTYALNILVQSIAFQQLPLQRRCFLRFHHPKAEIICNPHLEINIQQANQNILPQDIKCKLRFVSTPGNINRLLLAWPLKISICDSSERRIALATLNVGPLLEEEMNQCCYSVKLVDPRTSEEVGMLKVAMVLENYGQQQLGSRIFQTMNSEQDLGPAILDDRIAYRIVEELEDWKERQEILFKVELKKKEEAHLAALSEEWKQRHKGLEKNLHWNVEQCRLLAHSLNETTDELRLKTCKHAERERELSRYKVILEEKHKIKVMELKEAARRLEDDLNLKITSLEREKEDQEAKVKKLEKENSILKETIVAQEREMEEVKKNSLTKDQTASLLQELKSVEESLESALKSKSFFKEQWARAVRELHKFKSERLQAIQFQIKHNKEDLKNMGFHHMLVEGENELKEDKSTIQALRLLLNGLKTNQDNTHQTDAASPWPSVMSVHSLPSAKDLPNMTDIPAKKPRNNASSTNLSKQENDDNETRLRTLVEQRDSLMNTANYSLEDPTISKLNQEIRALLIHSNRVT